MKVVVLGAAGGIGWAVVRRLLADGHEVVGVDVAPPPDDYAHSALWWITGDAASDRVIDDAFDADGGPIGGLVHCVLAEDRASFAQQTSVRMADVIRTGALSAVRPLQLLAERSEAGAAYAVLVSSVHARFAHPGQSAYAVAKSALEAVGRAAAAELGADGVRCNIVRPGYVVVPRNAHRVAEPSQRERLAALQPLHRITSAEEIADVIVPLATGAFRAMTGSTITVDGGQTTILREGT